jgi:hypothetical protein
MGLGVLMAVILLHDVVGYRVLGEDRFCVVEATPVVDFEGSGSVSVEVADTGSGCTVPTAVCVKSRVLLPDVRRSC